MISADFIVTPQPIVVAVPPPQPRAPVAPAAERGTAGDPRRESPKDQNTPLSFRAALSAATFAGIARAATAVAPSMDDSAGEPFRRETRVPEAGPAVLSGAEARDIFVGAVTANERGSRAPAFAAAASHYAASYFAGSSFFARPGETLELSA